MPRGQSMGTGEEQPKKLPKDDVAAHPRLKRGRKKGAKTAVSFHDIYEPYEKKRAKVLARAVARRAAVRPELEAIRDRLFDGRTLTTKEAKRLVEQVGLRHFDSHWYRKEGIPIVSHGSYYVDPSSGVKLSTSNQNTHIAFEWKGQRRIIDPSAVDPNWRRCEVEIRLPGKFLRVRHQSVLGDIQNVVRALLRFYDWEQEDAAMFIMTGDTPLMPTIGLTEPPVSVDPRRDHLHYRITLHIEPWVSAKSVMKAYGRIQRRMRRGQVREIEKKSIDVFEFVETYLQEELNIVWTGPPTRRGGKGRMPRIPWKVIADQWHEQNKDQGRQKREIFYSGSDMRKKYLRFLKELLWRPVRIPPRKAES